MMKKVNFFIIGAPKSGTTSLYEYLYGHAKICFSESKEPNYFSSDFPGYQTVHSVEEYHRKEFSHCGARDELRGESSVWYLFSEVAVREIYEYNKDAKILILLRNPIDMLYSLHSQLLYNFDESESEFEKAWLLQVLRSEGKCIPKRCRVPEFLQYRHVGMYGEQLARVFKYFPKEQVKVILFEDFINDSRGVYAEVLAFLGLELDAKINFQAANPNKLVIFKPLAILIHRPPKLIVRMVGALKRVIGVHRLGIYSLLNKLNILVNTRQQERKPLRREFKQMMLDELIEDIEKTEKILSVDLSTWKNV